MQQTRLMTLIRYGSVALMFILTAELLRYGYRAIGRAWRFSFGEPERWNTHWAVDAGTVIEMGARTSYFALWISVIAASILSTLIALYILNRTRRFLIFDVRTANALRWLGLTLAFAMAYDQLFQAVDLYLVTRFNAAGPEPIRWNYDPSDFKSFIMGILLFLFGWIMLKGIDVARENEEYV